MKNWKQVVLYAMFGIFVINGLLCFGLWSISRVTIVEAQTVGDGSVKSENKFENLSPENQQRLLGVAKEIEFPEAELKENRIFTVPLTTD